MQALKDPPKPVEVPFTITPESLQTAKRPTVRSKVTTQALCTLFARA